MQSVCYRQRAEKKNSASYRAVRKFFRNFAPLDLSFVFQIQNRLRTRPELFFEKRIPQPSPEKDKLLSYPFESMKPFLRMLHEAANDKSVIAIKMTLYRLSRQSKVVEALIEAAENGKEVFVMIELKARFDEENNIEWSRRLEAADAYQASYDLEN